MRYAIYNHSREQLAGFRQGYGYAYIAPTGNEKANESEAKVILPLRLMNYDETLELAANIAHYLNKMEEAREQFQKDYTIAQAVTDRIKRGEPGP